MKSIAYVIPYFGTLPNKGFKMWLLSCSTNETIDFLLFIDDKTPYDYPENVKVTYMSFDQMKNKAQKIFDFPISLERPYKLCDYKPAYGEIFKEELNGYDFWGHCDIDLMFGDIRKFYNEDILSKYERVGRFAHSMLYKNTEENNKRFRTIVEGKLNYIEAYSVDTSFAFDEPHMDAIFEYLGIPFYDEFIFANLTKYETKFHLDDIDKSNEYKNESQIFTWDDGKVKRYYLHNEEIFEEEYMYIHFWCRPISFKVETFDKSKKYLIYSDVLSDKDFSVTKELIKSKGKGNPIAFYSKSLWRNRKKLTPKRIIFNIKGKINSMKG